ncbi:MAG: NAD(P)-binding domain-containing protein [bacterium]|nr:NAD(P)-binding domain-containing protein [bacterium]
MKIGILGTGVVGQTITEKLSQLGHQVMIGTRDKQLTLAKTGKDNFGRPPVSEWLKNNSKVQLGTYSEAASYGEFLVNATSGTGSLDALKLAGENNLTNKVLLDISNPLDFSKGMPPTLTICNTDSLGELIQRTFPNLKVVKSLNTLTAYLMVNPKLLPEPTNIFLNGNDTGAKNEVRNLLTTFGWNEKDIIDMGDITTARGTEQILPIWVRLWGTLQTPMFNFKIVVGK